MLDVSLLGTGGMMPMPNRFLSSALFRFNGRLIMIDCGEGTQISLKTLGWGFKAIDTILFTHYHADHISGLPGMLLAIANAGRTDPLTLIGPYGLSYIVEGLTRIARDLPFPLKLIEIEDKAGKIEMDGFSLSFCTGEHRVTCLAYRLDIKRRGKFNSKKATELGLPKRLWSYLQKTGEVQFNGKLITPDMVMGDERRGISVAFCTDTRPKQSFVKFVEKADLFICEGMYGDDDLLKKAMDKKHMIFSEAAVLANAANVSELWLTHFSPSLTVPEEFIKNATDIFPNTTAGYDRITKTLLFEETP